MEMVSFKLLLGFLFGAIITGIVVLGIVSYRNGMTSVETAERVRYTYEVLERSDEISSLFKTIQLESNAFFISGDSSILVPYWSARNQILPRIEELATLTQDNSNQKPRIDSLAFYVNQVISFTNWGMLKKDGHFTTEELGSRVETHFRYRQIIRQIIQGVKNEEEMLLIKREQAHQASIAAFNRTFFLLLSAIGALLVTTFFSIRYNFNKRIRAQEDQRKATELFTKLFYESPMGIVISRLETGEIIDCNNAYSELIKYTKTELIGKTAVQLGILSTLTQREDIVRDARHSRIRDIDVQLRPKNGDPIWVTISMQSILIDDNDCLLSAVLDMTAHKEAEEKVKQALLAEIELNKLKSNFVTLASHEFRTPLTTILSSTFLLENYSFGQDKEKVTKHVARIKGSVNLLTSILDEFLSLTKIEEGKIEPKREQLNLKKTLEELCTNFQTLTRPGQKITFHHSGDEEVYSDPILLGNIVTNLISNAIKYSNENGKIFVSSVVNAKVHISVKDEGIGISKEDQEHLFERFFRASNAGNIQGTGLGLHIMKHYVDMLNGSVKVQSEPGKGSEFSVTFNHG